MAPLWILRQIESSEHSPVWEHHLEFKIAQLALGGTVMRKVLLFEEQMSLARHRAQANHAALS